MDLKLIIQGVVGFIVSAFLAFEKYSAKYKEIISWIALRIEKDSADGKWTNKEKEQMAVDLYKKGRSMLPWYIRIIPSYFTSKIIRSLIRKICKKAGELKEK